LVNQNQNPEPEPEPKPDRELELEPGAVAMRLPANEPKGATCPDPQ